MDSRSKQLINEVKAILENETELDEMARKAFNNFLTAEGKKAITAAVKKMIEEDKEGKAEHSKTFYFKALATLAKSKVGEPVLTTKIQDASGCKYPQPINKLLTQLKDAGYLTRETSHVEPEPKEPGQRGRPKGPEKEKVEKAPKMGGLNLPSKKKSEESPEDNTVTEETANPKAAPDKDEKGHGSLDYDPVDKKKLDKDDEGYYEKHDREQVYEAEELDELNLLSLEKSMIAQFGIDGNSKGGKEEPLNESFLRMNYIAGIITDSQYVKRSERFK